MPGITLMNEIAQMPMYGGDDYPCAATKPRFKLSQ